MAGVDDIDEQVVESNLDGPQGVEEVYSFEKGRMVPDAPLSELHRIQLQHRKRTCMCCLLHGEL
jgi:hypothetical protein